MQVKDQRLSGPVSAYITEFKGKKYIFLGDRHESLEAGCSKPCKSIDDYNDKNIEDVDLEDPNGCWDIALFLSGLFTKAAKEGKWIDFYIEIPFRKDIRLSKEGVKKSISYIGYLSLLYYIFYDCFAKMKCDYSTTRFHYIDIRKEYKLEKLARLVNDLEKIKNNENIIREIPVSYESFISNKVIAEGIENLIDILLYGGEVDSKEIIEADILVRDLYFTAEDEDIPKSEQLFLLYLRSDNIYEDIEALFRKSLNSAKNPDQLLERLLPNDLIVTRNGKTMHRMRAQLWALENEGKGDIAEKIIQYVTLKYRERTQIKRIVVEWRNIRNLYLEYIKRPFLFTYEIKENLENTQERLTNINIRSDALLVDAYLLARIFRTYPNTSHIESYKSIVYAGAAHISLYVDFFEKYLGAHFLKNTTIIVDNYENTKRCLNINTQDF